MREYFLKQYVNIRGKKYINNLLFNFDIRFDYFCLKILFNKIIIIFIVYIF